MFHSDELDAFKGFKAEWNTVKESTEPPTIKSAAHGKRVMLGKKCDLNDFLARAKLERSKNWNRTRKRTKGDQTIKGAAIRVCLFASKPE